MICFFVVFSVRFCLFCIFTFSVFGYIIQHIQTIMLHQQQHPLKKKRRNEIFTFSLENLSFPFLCNIYSFHFFSAFNSCTHCKWKWSSFHFFVWRWAIDDGQINVTFVDELSIQLTFVNRKSDNKFQPIFAMLSLCGWFFSIFVQQLVFNWRCFFFFQRKMIEKIHEIITNNLIFFNWYANRMQKNAIISSNVYRLWHFMYGNGLTIIYRDKP